MKRPDFIKHFLEIQRTVPSPYPGGKEPPTTGSPFSEALGLKRTGIWLDVLKPGTRSSWPHAHSADEEFVFVVKGDPDVWIDGVLYALKPGDGVGFVPGTGIAHTFLNNTDSEVELLVVGDSAREDDLAFYPLHPEGNARLEGRGRYWKNHPVRELGSHHGKPKGME